LNIVQDEYDEFVRNSPELKRMLYEKFPGPISNPTVPFKGESKTKKMAM
jgi:hypothetical protein